MDELKKNLEQAFLEYVAAAAELGEAWIEEVRNRKDWEFYMNMQALFELVPEVKISAIARRAGINESLMRQYATGKAVVSEDRLRYIEQTIHDLGRELQTVKL